MRSSSVCPHTNHAPVRVARTGIRFIGEVYHGRRALLGWRMILAGNFETSSLLQVCSCILHFKPLGFSLPTKLEQLQIALGCPLPIA